MAGRDAAEYRYRPVCSGCVSERVTIQRSRKCERQQEERWIPAEIIRDVEVGPSQALLERLDGYASKLAAESFFDARFVATPASYRLSRRSLPGGGSHEFRLHD